jgi:hypothetical protein
MGLFDSAAIKRLKAAAGPIGQTVAEESYGITPSELADDRIANHAVALKQAYASAAAEIGAQKALQKATHEAESWARMAAEVMKEPVGEVAAEASRKITSLLG